jgi:polyisoprenoid-binding protein YceI
VTSMSTPPTVHDPAGTASRGRRRWLIVAVVSVGVIALAAGGASYLFFGGEPPAAADLDAAAGAAGATPGASAPAGETPASAEPSEDTEPGPSTLPADASLDGTWRIDTSIGSFSDFTSTWAGFRVKEVLAQGIGGVEAVGRTPGVSGSLELSGPTLLAAAIEADLTAIVSDRPRRDGAIQRALETSSFPTATFVLTEPVDLGGVPQGGQTVGASAAGELTIHGSTRDVVVDLEARLVDDTIVVVGSTGIVFSDYGVTMPTAPIVVSVADEGIVELQLFFTRQGG